jgi:DNA (cytosine-5)-methyltransferase 1
MPRFTTGIYSKPASPFQDLLRSEGGMTPDSHRFARHTPEVSKVFERLLKEAPRCISIAGEDRSKYGLKKRSVAILSGRRVSPTLTSIPDDYIHYREPRILTVRESARLQSFPDWFEFLGNYTTGGKARANEVPRYTQVGNAIPPLFAELAGEVLLYLLNEDARQDNRSL